MTPAGVLSRPSTRAGLGSRSRVRGRVPVGSPGRGAGAGLPEALLPGRARWESGGSECPLMVIAKPIGLTCAGTEILKE